MDDDGAKSRKQLMVRFDLDGVSEHEIAPYAEIYGVHPRDFVFDRDFYMVPAGDAHGFTNLKTVAQALGFIDDDDEEAEAADSDDENPYWSCAQDILQPQQLEAMISTCAPKVLFHI
eukprot:TRINITY_DN58320_c0_g1_i1.p1 TRINITY_DN58320_c0_g1~~TRINITY_DN58320_c0_g1_i1.p1  ORF type:complete len:131 (-),score=36.04 TRINITY_DN58320_c0_g1_i1:54-404(-)